MRTYPTVTPGLLYHHAPEMIEWLCTAFGLHRKRVIPGAGNSIVHAHLTLGNGGIMLSSAETNAFPNLCKTPRESGGVGTVEIIVFVEDIEAHYARAKAAGAVILIELEDKPYGGKGYTCEDPEGHVWAFGSYDPWAE